jgi:hypothetical protein
MKAIPSSISRKPIALFTALLTASLLFSAPMHAGTAKLEYTVVSAHLNNRNLEALLNSYASQGWELVQITNGGVAIFKRVKR